MKKILLQIVGYISVTLGFIGVAVPMLPTTPFLLLAVYCFSRSSPKMNSWLLDNHIFGKYLRNFEDGLGIPLTVKIAANITLWSSILFTTIVILDEWWIRGLLIAMATFVTIHIAKIKTLRHIHKILLIVPTEMEMEALRSSMPTHIKVAICGIGPYKTAYHTTELIKNERPQMVILAGIAGAYAHSGLKIGETVMVSDETAADMGSFANGQFIPKFSEKYGCNKISTYSTLPQVESNSVCTAATPHLRIEEAKIENMEGAAFFYCCTQAQVSFLEIRTISNIVGDEISKWNISLATSNLSTELKKLINEIKS